MPLDPPDGEGNLLAWRDGGGRLIVRAERVRCLNAAIAPEFAIPARSHFATCPNADKHRRSR